MKMKRLLWGFIAIAAVTLVGCGGGGGTSLMVGGERATQDLIDALQDDRDGLAARPDITQADLDALRARPDITQAMLDALNARPDITQADLDALSGRPDITQAMLDALNARPDITQAMLDALNARPDITQADLDALMARPDITQAMLDALNARPDITQAMLDTLNARPDIPVTEEMYNAIVLAVRTALGADALDDLADAVAKLGNAYSTSEEMRTEEQRTMMSVMAKGFLQTMADVADASTTTMAPAPTEMNTEAESTSDGLEVTFVGTDGVSAFSPFPAGDGPTVPALPGFKHTVLRADSAGAEASTHFQAVAFYSDADGLGPKSLIVDEGEASTAKSFNIMNAMNFDTNGMADGAPAAPAAGATTTTRVGTLVTPTTGDPRLEFEGSWRGVAGTFICTDGTCSGATATNADNGLLLTSMTDADSMTTLSATIESGQMWVFAPTDSAATVMVHDEDYLYLGWWHEVPNEDEPGTAADPSNHGFSAFAGGSVPFDMTDFVMLEGDATYTGEATGKYAQQGGTLLNPTFRADAFTAKASLTAKFGADNVAGMIDGSIHTFLDGSGNELAGWKVTLMSTTLQDSANEFTGATDTSAVGQISGTNSTEGDWSGGLFGSGGRTDKEPNGVAGTFRAEWGVTPNEHTALSGAFAATHD